MGDKSVQILLIASARGGVDFSFEMQNVLWNSEKNVLRSHYDQSISRITPVFTHSFDLICLQEICGDGGDVQCSW